MNNDSLVVSLQAATNVSLYGSKAVSLSFLLNDDCPVPNGFVISTAGLEQHINELGLDFVAQKILDGRVEASSSEAEELRNSLLRCQFSDDFQCALTSAHQALQAEHGDNAFAQYVVRSSAVGEDGSTHSFAGQYLSLNNLSNISEISKAIRRVWSSLFEPHAIAYANNCEDNVVRMAVLVQLQVDAQFSGVLFTRDPMNPGSNSMIAESCPGLATHLVDGSITPSRFQIDENLQIHCDTKDEFGRTLVGMHTNALCELATTAKALEVKRGCALDIEWCVDTNGQFQLVQSRPVTSLVGAPMEDWSNANIAENYFEPVVPLLASFIVRGYAGYFRSLAGVFGISHKRIAASTESFDGLVGLHAGRPYYNLTHIFTVLHLVPGGGYLANTFNVFTGARASPKPVAETHTPKWERWLDAARGLVFLPWHALRIERGVCRFEQRIDTFATATSEQQLSKCDAGSLAKFIVEFLALREFEWRDAALSDASASISYAALGALLKRWTHENSDVQRNALLQGLPGLASAKPVEALWDVAHEIRQIPHLVNRVIHSPDRDVQILLDKHAPSIGKQFDQWFSTWGFRYSGELLLTRPTPQEDPLPVIRLLKTYLATAEIGPAQVSQQRELERLAMTDKITHNLGNNFLSRFFRGFVFRSILAATHRSIRWRERARMKQALLYTRLRLVCLALGKLITELGITSSSDDILFLEIDEIIELAGSIESNRCSSAKSASLDLDQLAQLISERRNIHAQQKEQQAPPDEFKLPKGARWSGQVDRPTLVDTPCCTEEYLHGIPASSGEATGTVSVVLDVAQIDQVERGTILVTHQTDPGWAPVFFLTKGLIIERGGQLSHGAIIAREYGIPAVVGVTHATTQLTDGERVYLHGNLGRIKRLDV